MNDFAAESYKPSDAEPFMSERQREYFRRKLIAWREAILAESRDTLAALQLESEESSGHRRPGLLRDRSRDRTSCPGQTTQANFEDQVRARPHRGRLLWLLRRNGGSDLASPAGRTPDRHAVGRGAGAPRAAREDLPRRIRGDGSRCLGAGRPQTVCFRVDSKPGPDLSTSAEKISLHPVCEHPADRFHSPIPAILFGFRAASCSASKQDRICFCYI